MQQRSKSSYYRWELLLLLFLAYFFHQGDRAIFGVVVSDIKTDLNLTDNQIGMAASFLFATLALMVPIAGFAGDRYSKKWLITGSILFWSLATMLTGWANGLLGLIVFRSIATAGGESFYGPAATALIAGYHKKTRSFALAIHQSSLYIGVIVSGFVAGWIAENFGWRVPFYIFGGIGFLIGCVFIFRLKDLPSGGAPQNTAEPSVSTEKKLSPFAVAGRLLRIRSVWLLTSGFVAIVFVNNAYLVWATKFLEVKFDLPLTEAGGFSMLYHHLAALIFIMIGGALSDLMVRRFSTFRVHLQWTSMLIGAPIIYIMGASASLTTVYVMMFLFGAMRGLYETNTHAAIFDVVPPQFRASLVGLMIMVAFLIGSISPWFLGFLQDRMGDAAGLSLGFELLSISWVIGGLAVLTASFFTFKKDRYIETEELLPAEAVRSGAVEKRG